MNLHKSSSSMFLCKEEIYSSSSHSELSASSIPVQILFHLDTERLRLLFFSMRNISSETRAPPSASCTFQWLMSLWTPLLRRRFYLSVDGHMCNNYTMTTVFLHSPFNIAIIKTQSVKVHLPLKQFRTAAFGVASITDIIHVFIFHSLFSFLLVSFSSVQHSSMCILSSAQLIIIPLANTLFIQFLEQFFFQT